MLLLGVKRWLLRILDTRNRESSEVTRQAASTQELSCILAVLYNTDRREECQIPIQRKIYDHSRARVYCMYTVQP